MTMRLALRWVVYAGIAGNIGWLLGYSGLPLWLSAALAFATGAVAGHLAFRHTAEEQ